MMLVQHLTPLLTPYTPLSIPLRPLATTMNVATGSTPLPFGPHLTAEAFAFLPAGAISALCCVCRNRGYDSRTLCKLVCRLVPWPCPPAADEPPLHWPAILHGMGLAYGRMDGGDAEAHCVESPTWAHLEALTRFLLDNVMARHGPAEENVQVTRFYFVKSTFRPLRVKRDIDADDGGMANVALMDTLNIEIMDLNMLVTFLKDEDLASCTLGGCDYVHFTPECERLVEWCGSTGQDYVP